MIAPLMTLALGLTYIIADPVLTMRVEPNDRAEVNSQALFAEEIRILDRQDNWLDIETLHDNYRGWVPVCANPGLPAWLTSPGRPVSSVIALQQPYARNDDTYQMVKINRRAAHIYRESDVSYGPLLTLPYEVQLRAYKSTVSGCDRWITVELPDNTIAYVQRGDVECNPKPLHIKQVLMLARSMQGLPYTWGGRSSFGYDCSGFTQMLYRQMGVHLPRDARDQINDSQLTEIALDDAELGDLIFFGSAADHITHVGICLNNTQCIHATVHENMPYIHISSLLHAPWNGSEASLAYRAARRRSS